MRQGLCYCDYIDWSTGTNDRENQHGGEPDEAGVAERERETVDIFEINRLPALYTPLY